MCVEMNAACFIGTGTQLWTKANSEESLFGMTCPKAGLCTQSEKRAVNIAVIRAITIAVQQKQQSNV